MKYRIIVRPDAEDDLKEACSWYEDKRTGLGYDCQVPRKPRLVGGVKGHNINKISFAESPALWAGSFTSFCRLMLG